MKELVNFWSDPQLTLDTSRLHIGTIIITSMPQPGAWLSWQIASMYCSLGLAGRQWTDQAGGLIQLSTSTLSVVCQVDASSPSVAHYYYYYYTWVLLWWRCRTTAAGPPYNVSVTFRMCEWVQCSCLVCWRLRLSQGDQRDVVAELWCAVTLAPPVL